MKAGLFVAAALVPLALAQPRVNNHEHIHKRQTVTDVEVVTTQGPDVVVYVNAQGVPTATSTAWDKGVKSAPAVVTVSPTDKPHKKHHHKHHNKHHGHHHKQAPAPAPAPVPAPAPAPAPVDNHHPQHKHQQKVPSALTAPAPQVEHNGHPHHHPSNSAGASTGTIADTTLGMVYSPYNDDGSCKTKGQVESDFGNIKDYGMVRIYGTDCDQVNTVGTTAMQYNMKVMAGVFDLSDVVGDIQFIISGFKSNWAGIDTVVIGNELVNSGLNSVAEVVGAVNTARPILRAAGFTGPVVTVDTFDTIIANPELCQASDYAAANAHPFFDPSQEASNAGNWVRHQHKAVSNACGGMKTVITESGWPWQGSPNGNAVPSRPNQEAAISSLKSNFATGGLVLFTAYDDMWKTNTAATFNAEQFWGIYQ